MKVLRVVASMDPKLGGVTEAINQSAIAFNKNECSIEVLCFDDFGARWVGLGNGYTIHTVGKGITSYAINFSYFSWLWKNARNYDVVILDGLWQFLSLGAYFLKLLGVPYCVFTHGMLDPYFNQDKTKYYKKLPFWWLVERNVIALANCAIFTCEEERELAARSFPAFKAKSKITTLGVESNHSPAIKLESLFFDNFPKLIGKRFALFLSRIHKKKGLDILIEALGASSELPGDYMLVIAGPDSDGLKDELAKRIEALGLVDRVMWLGMLGGDLKWAAYHAADVFVLPSHQENFGIVVAEALSTGTPVLITNKVNIWREVKNSGAGFVGNDDVEGVELLLKSWFELSGKDRQLMSARALNCYQEKFSLDVSSHVFQETLVSAIKSSKQVVYE